MLVVMSGPSGVGKDTLKQELKRRLPELRIAVSATTRPPRPYERDGVDYHFMSVDRFQQLIAAGAFVESASYAGELYGTLHSELQPRREGEVVMLETDVQGAMVVRARLPQARLIFVAPPSLEELRKRLVGRGSDSPEQVERRMRHARWELAQAGAYDHQVVNDQLEQTADEIVAIIQREAGRLGSSQARAAASVS